MKFNKIKNTTPFYQKLLLFIFVLFQRINFLRVAVVSVAKKDQIIALVIASANICDEWIVVTEEKEFLYVSRLSFNASVETKEITYDQIRTHIFK